MDNQISTKLSSAPALSVPYSECICLTCNHWAGQRHIDLSDPIMCVTCDGISEGNCVDGPWNGLSILAHQRCNEYQQWPALKTGFCFISDLLKIWGNLPFHAHLMRLRLKMLENPAASIFSARIDRVLHAIDQFMTRDTWIENPPLLTRMKFAAWTIFVDPLFNAFYWLGLTARKPLSEMTGKDIDFSVKNDA